VLKHHTLERHFELRPYKRSSNDPISVSPSAKYRQPVSGLASVHLGFAQSAQGDYLPKAAKRRRRRRRRRKYQLKWTRLAVS
jgi:hypothetical protein